MLFVLGWLTFIVVIGMFLLIALGIWLLVDAFLIPGMIEQKNMQLVNSLTGQGFSEPQRSPVTVVGGRDPLEG